MYVTKAIQLDQAALSCCLHQGASYPGDRAIQQAHAGLHATLASGLERSESDSTEVSRCSQSSSPGTVPSSWSLRTKVPMRNENTLMPFSREPAYQHHPLWHLMEGCHGNTVGKANAEQEDEPSGRSHIPRWEHQGSFSGKWSGTDTEFTGILNINEFLSQSVTLYFLYDSKTCN